MEYINEFKMNLQRFSEDATPVEDTADSNQEVNNDSEDTTAKMPRIAVKDGQLVFLDGDEEVGYPSDGQEGEGDEEGDSDQNQTQEPQLPTKIKLNDNTEVDLQELKDSYFRQSDYTRKTQEIAEKQRQLDALISNPAALLEYVQRSQLQNIPNQPPDPKAVYKQEFDEIKASALKEVEEILGETYNSADDEHLALFTDALARKRFEKNQQVYEYNQKQHEFKSVMQKHVTNPEWKEIDVFAGEVMRQLPSYMADDIKEKIANGDLHALDSFLTLATESYYKLKNPPKPETTVQRQVQAPPKLESSGTGDSSSSVGVKFDGKKFSQGNIYDKMDYMEKMGIFGTMASLKK